MKTNIYKEMLPYVTLFMHLASSILAVALVYSAKNLVARGWLIASTAITLVTLPSYTVVSIIANYATDRQQTYNWFEVLNLMAIFGTACFAFFLFSLWSRSRIKLEVGNLLFSFSGRIPRSAFWISACILFPLGTLIGFAPFTTEATGLVAGIIWTVYAAWFLFSIWISLAIYAKRMHDCARSGWTTIILLVPIAGPIWFLGYCGFVRGTSGSNKYGDDPLNTDSLAV